MVRVVSVAAVALFSLNCWAQSSTPPDALPLRDHRSTSLAFLRPIPLGPVLTQGTQTQWDLTVANEMRDDFPVYEDAETWRLGYLYRKAIKGGGEWFVELPLLARNGGVLDPFLAWWHNMIGIPFELRQDTSYGHSDIRVPGGDYNNGLGIGDLTLGYGRQTAIGAARVWLKLPTGNPNELFGSGNLDLAVSLDQSWKLIPRFWLAAQGGLTVQGKPSELQSAKGLVESANLALSYTPNTRDVWAVQWTHEGSPVVYGNGAYVDHAHRAVGLTYTRRGPNTDWSLYFQEDRDFGLFTFAGGAEVAPDWTMGFIYRVHF